MSLSLHPSSFLGFPSACSNQLSLPASIFSPTINLLLFSEPPSQVVTRTLTISNNNVYPVAFKIKATVPKVHLIPGFFVLELIGSAWSLAVQSDPKFGSGGAWSVHRGPR